MLFQVVVCRLPSDGGEQRDQSRLAASHSAGVSAGSHHRSAEDSEHPLPPGSQVGTHTDREAHTHTLNLKNTVGQPSAAPRPMGFGDVAVSLAA